MELREWRYMNPPKSTQASTSSSGYKKRFEKLIKYHIDHASSELESITFKDIKEDIFHLSEHYNTGSDEFNRSIIVSVNKYTDEFFLSIFVDGKEVYHNVYKSYEEVLEILTDTYMFLPDKGTQDYDDLLTESLNEWKYANPPTQQAQASASSTKGGYWERFNKLLFYHVNHKSPAVDKVVRTKVSKDGFHYTEHVRAGTTGFDKDVVVNIDLAATEDWKFQTYIDGKPHIGGAGYGYVKLLKELRKHMNLPAEGTPEYTKLLTEDFSSELKEWKLMSAPSTFYKDKFKKLLDYHIAHPNPAYKIVSHNIDKLSEDTDKASFSYVEEYEDDKGKTKESLIGVRYYKKDKTWTVKVYINGIQVADKHGVGFNILIAELDVRMTLPPRNSTEYQDLLESVESSIADDFKTYENLWEDVDVEEYNIVLGKTSYNLYDDSDLDAYLTQSARLMRKPVGNEKPLEFFKLQKINMMLRTPKYYNNKKLADKLLIVKAELESELN